MSEGAPLTAYVYQAKANAGGAADPVAVQRPRRARRASAHHASRFAEAGGTALTFDYRGWGRVPEG
jgi:hypothetical protein